MNKSTAINVAIAFVALGIVAAFFVIGSSDDTPRDVEVSASGDEGVSSITGVGQYKSGDQVTLTATFRDGYMIDAWFDTGGHILSRQNPYVVEADDIHVILKSKPEPMVEMVLEGDRGIMFLEGSGQYIRGQIVTLSAVLKDGYAFGGWYADGKIVSSEDEVTVQADNLTYEARTVPVKDVHVYVYKDGGISEVSGAGDYGIGEDVLLEAVMRDGKKFLGWYDSKGNLLGTDNPMTVPADKMSVQARSTTDREVTVTVYSGAGVGSTSGGGDYRTGDRVTLSAEPMEGYRFSGWYDGYGHRVSADPSYTFAAEKDVTFQARGSQGYSYVLLRDTGTHTVGSGNSADKELTYTYSFDCYGDDFLGWYTLDGDLFSKERKLELKKQDTLLVAKSAHNLYLGDNRVLFDGFPEWYDSDCCCVVLDSLSKTYVASFGGITSPTVGVIPGVYDIVYYNGQFGDRAEYVVETFEVGGSVTQFYHWYHGDKPYDIRLDVDMDEVKSFNAKKNDRNPYETDGWGKFANTTTPGMLELKSELERLSAGMDENTRAQFLLDFVQKNTDYQYDTYYIGQEDYWKYSIETLYEHRGDCEDCAVLHGSVMKMMGYDVMLLRINIDEKTDHIFTGVCLDGIESENYFEYQGKKYYYCEATGTFSEIGDELSWPGKPYMYLRL